MADTYGTLYPYGDGRYKGEPETPPDVFPALFLTDIAGQMVDFLPEQFKSQPWSGL